MMDWAKAHPWMTFFLISGAVSTLGMVASGKGFGYTLPDGTEVDPNQFIPQTNSRPMRSSRSASSSGRTRWPPSPAGRR